LKEIQMSRYSFAGKNVIVTGASGGLGSALSERLANQGANLIVTSRSTKALDHLASRLAEGTRVITLAADLSVRGQAEILAAQALEKAGHVDAVFNNAGIGYFALMEEATEENIRHLFEVNTFSPIALVKALLPHMKERGSGRIINIVSAAGRVPIPTVGVYGGSKSALAVMANTMRLELEPAGIEIINVYPGTIDSSFEENALREEHRPGLCPTAHCGVPRWDIADQVMKAAAGPPGEVWLEPQGRWLSAAALIWPKFVDRRLSPVRDKVTQTTSRKTRRWRTLHVESATAYDLQSVTCPSQDIRDQAENRAIMTQDVWDAIRPHLHQVTSIEFTGGGEPLFQPQLTQWVAEAKKAGCETGILTNGLLLSKERAGKLIEAGLDWICVSLDGATAEVHEKIRQGSDFNRVCSNLGTIAEMRRGRIPKTIINFVLMKMNFHQAEEIVKLAKHLGVDQVNFKQCDVIRGEQGNGSGFFSHHVSKEIRHLEKDLAKARSLARKLKVVTTAFSFNPREQPVCDQDPRNSVFIRFDGSAAPCINLAIGGPTTFLGDQVTMPKVHYGRVQDHDVLELWENKTSKYYRDLFNERVKAYEDVFVEALTGGPRPGHERLLKMAVNAMPRAAEGCRVCHYLYDV
jgi:short-subunit dehydrogenase/MoaA/NifB/PqqE/SkfB family radical SAM enzyme